MAVQVSVVVPVRDGAASLPALLDSLSAQTLDRAAFETIVVDNASRDDTAAVARARGATVVTEPVPNRSRARNAGVRAAQAPLLAFTDADCVASPHWLAALLGCADRAPLVAGPVEVTTREPPSALERFETRWRFGQQAWVRDGWAATANLLVHRDAFEAIGGFDTAYRAIGEDADLCLRAARAGHALAYCEDALVLHAADTTLRPFLRRSFRHGYSVNQCFHRLGVGYRAWRDPAPALRGDAALALFGWSRGDFDQAEWRHMRRLARAGYAMRVAGSVWAELRRAR